MFQSLRPGSRVFLLEKKMGQTPSLKTGQVESVSQPQYKTINNTGYGGIPSPSLETVVNLRVRFDDGPMDYNQIPANSTVADFKNGFVLIDNTQDVILEIDNLMEVSRQALASRQYHESVLQWGPHVKSQLNPNIAKEEERDRKIDNLNQQISMLTNSVSQLVSLWSSSPQQSQGDGNMKV